jgi:cobalt/nickel transport system permease protein
VDIARIDYWAVSGRSVLHRASVPSKVLATAAVIATVIIASHLPLLAALYVMVIITVRAAGLPPLKVIAISLLPGLFALLFAISKAGEGLFVPLTILLKAFTAASAMILLLSTTPFNNILGFIGRILPRVLRDGLFMTYRSFFILFKLMDNLITAIRLRGGFQRGRFLKNARNIGSGVGIIFVNAYDKSQMLYDVMFIRGYAGRLSGKQRYGAISLNDLPYLLVTALFLGEAVYAIHTGRHESLSSLVIVLLIYAALMEGLRVWKRS